MDSREVPVWCTPAMARFLESNRPWSHLVARKEIVIEPLRPGEPLEFDGLAIRAFLSPHRGEDTDTIGLEIQGPRQRVVWCTDADHLPKPLVDRICDADLAFVDGTFYSAAELPHREILAVRHPFVQDSVRALAGARGEVRFVHLNHTNPLLEPDPSLRPPLPPGFSVAREDERFAL
jgi:pyrroloquinoline quinone biosynthesis protein B